MVAQRPPLDLAAHKIQPGDKVLIKVWKESTLTPKWEGPFLVLLTTDSATWTAEKGWTHISPGKGPIHPEKWRVGAGDDPVKLKLSKDRP